MISHIINDLSRFCQLISGILSFFVGYVESRRPIIVDSANDIFLQLYIEFGVYLRRQVNNEETPLHPALKRGRRG
ncbi:MAG: hypothetical protein J6K32_02735 [Clostridia bacterium]|nr:hypothetical protein [Clostridia bacterium]